VTSCVFFVFFRRGKSILDELIRLESYIRDGFIRKEQIVAIIWKKHMKQLGCMVF